MPEHSRLVLDLRRRIMSLATTQDDVTGVDLRGGESEESESVALPPWLEQSEEERKRPVFERWRR